MPPRNPSMPSVKRKRARGKIRPPLESWFQTDLQNARKKALKKSPVFNLWDFYYVHLLEQNILTIQNQSFGLHPGFLSKLDAASLSPAKGIVFAYLLVDALRGYAQSEWAWLHKDPGEFAREFSQLAKKVESWQGAIFEDDGQLVKVLRKTARQVKKKWSEGNAIEQAFLYARRRLIQDIRVLIEEFLPLPKKTQSAVTNRLCCELLLVFHIGTSSNQYKKKLLQTVRQDRQRHEASFREFDGMRRSSLKRKIVILEQSPHGNAAQKPCSDNRSPLPPYRICTTPFELRPSWPPLLDPTDYSLPDWHDLY